MQKKLQVVLNQDINKLEKSGDVVEVALAYTRNYLIPRKIDIRTTPGILKQVERYQKEERQRQIELKQTAVAQKTALETVCRFKIAKQVGENDAIFATVTDREAGGN